MLRRALATAAAALALAAAPASSSTAAARFEIRAVATSDGARTLLSAATVTTPASSEIRVTAEDGPYRIAARFVTRADGDAVHIAARVETRRLAGRSARGLDLFEEDVRTEAARLSGDGGEALAVFPFGRGADGEVLSIEVVPVLVAGAALAAPEIRIDAPGRWIRVEAETVPEAFAVEAEVVSGERVVASGAARAHLGEPARVALAGESGAAAALALTVDRYVPGCESGRVSFSFDLDGPTSPLARRWSGVVGATGAAEYPLDGWPGGATLRIRCTPERGSK